MIYIKYKFHKYFISLWSISGENLSFKKKSSTGWHQSWNSSVPAISMKVPNQKTGWQIPATASITPTRTRTAVSSAIAPWRWRTVTVASAPHFAAEHTTNLHTKKEKLNKAHYWHIFLSLQTTWGNSIHHDSCL